MVIFAYVDTNITDVLRSSVDEIHHVTYHGAEVRIKGKTTGPHRLNISTGGLELKNIYRSELSVVEAIVGGYKFADNRFHPNSIPKKEEWYSFPTLFELERIAKEPIIIMGIKSLSLDGLREFKKEDDYFQKEKGELDGFIAAYAQALGDSQLQKPVLEGFYNQLKRENVRSLQESKDFKRSEGMRDHFRRSVYQEHNFISAFGANIYHQLREILGEPQFS